MNCVLTEARLVTMQPGVQGYQVTEPQTLIIEQGRIQHIGQPIDLPSDAHPISCAGKLVTPGLIDCHTHLVYAGSRANEFELRLQGVPYQTIAAQGGGILSTVNATRKASEEELIELALPRLDGLLRSGVTSVEVKSGYGLTLKDELKMLRAAKALEQHRRVKITTTLLAAHALPPEFQGRSDDYIAHICQEIIPRVAEEQLAISVDVFCESIGFSVAQTERVFHAAQAHGLQIKGHTEQLSNLGGSALTARMGGLSVDHIEYLDEAGVKALAQSSTVATLLPGAFYFLRETQKPPIEWLRQHRVPMAISTDLNPGTSPFADLSLMMNMGCTLFGLTPEETLRGVTCHAAQALGYAANRGQIVEGYDADLAIWNIEHPAELSYQVGVSRLHARIVNGELSYES
ncbi:TPA: imidazolonepropionase [Vibrio cholerae]|uniref:imidazolonepropionase n=1 Tax=Vibrio cholerae TaxID=666 RepID=UPI001D30837D|nr:imidazolonepropionase [Vibrio cholerae]EGR4139332.1 imidazolonepropionase [Vibrio cholerae]EGR4281681.1 imidazolonepropionase [Vibrio cholerae]HBK7251461.1 imidazolonepropionase [Vibrio cholerae]